MSEDRDSLIGEAERFIRLARACSTAAAAETLAAMAAVYFKRAGDAPEQQRTDSAPSKPPVIAKATPKGS
jgi:hypothetical protein